MFLYPFRLCLGIEPHMPTCVSNDETYKQLPCRRNQSISYEILKDGHKPLIEALPTKDLVRFPSNMHIISDTGTKAKELSTSPCKDSGCNPKTNCYTKEQIEKDRIKENNAKCGCERKNPGNQVKREIFQLQKQYDILIASLEQLNSSIAMKQSQ